MIKKNCLITGGCGFIGRHFTKKMFDEGYEIDVVDNFISKSSLRPDDWPKHLKCHFNFFEDDVSNFLNSTKKCYDVVIHAAAIVGGRETIENDPFSISQNITTDNDLFRWMEKNPVKYFIYFSSSAAYPTKFQNTHNFRKLKLNDTDIFNQNICIPDLTYGWSKLTGEYFLSILSKRCDTTFSVYRPFSGYGEDQHDSYPFPSILKKVSSGKEAIEIWSDAVRDFVYIDDIVDYVLSTCFHDKKFRILNIGTGVATSMSELANKISNIIFHRDIKINILDDKPKGVFYRVAEENNDFHWTTLNDGIKKCISFL